MQQKANHLLNHSMRVIVYIAFFAVQTFYNFDTVGAPAAAGKPYFSTSDKHSTGSVEKTPLHRGQNHKFRLNKRFAPKYVSLSNAPLLEHPHPVSKKTGSGFYADVFIPFSLLVHGSLRGPPALPDTTA
jgi:hypothetical protein